MKKVFAVILVAFLMAGVYAFGPKAVETNQATEAKAKKVVYFCTTGDKVYHKVETCTELKACTSKKSNTKKYAKKNGYKQCEVCK